MIRFFLYHCRNNSEREMKDFVALYIDNKQRVGILSQYPQLQQNDSQVADDSRAASNWQQDVDGMGKPLVSM